MATHRLMELYHGVTGLRKARRSSFRSAMEPVRRLPPWSFTLDYFFVSSQLDQLYAEYAAIGVEVVREPDTMPWGMREFTIRDCNGSLLRFGTLG